MSLTKLAQVVQLGTRCTENLSKKSENVIKKLFFYILGRQLELDERLFRK
jgi:hypothetical protein